MTSSAMAMRLVAVIGSIALALAVAWLARRFYRAALWKAHQGRGMASYRRAHPIGAYFRLTFPLLCVLSPTLEEALFRGPLLLCFERISLGAWVGIIAMGLGFGATHYRNVEKWAGAEPQPNSFQAFSPRQLVIAKLFNASLASALGIALGYVAVRYQSLWLSIGLHAAWNLLSPVVHVVLMGLIIVLVGPLVQGALALSRLLGRVGRKARQRDALESLVQSSARMYSTPPPGGA